MTRILLAEDDTMIASGISYAFSAEGYEVVHVISVSDAKEKLQKENYDIAVLDMQLPDGMGFEINEILQRNRTAVVFLTVTDDENTIVKAFDSGAADYIVKPFRIRELLARVRRLTAVGGNSETCNLIRIGGATINTDEAKVYIGSETVSLTALEYRLLLIFANHPGMLLSRQQILDAIWDVAGNFVEDNTLTVYVKRLREKLGDAVTIETVRGMGYRVDQ